MALTQHEILEALRPVKDPELHRSIVDLNMVRGIDIDGGDVGILIALTVAGCPMRAEITELVVHALSTVRGVERVKVDMTVMTPEELDEVRQMLAGGYDQAHADQPWASQANEPTQDGGEHEHEGSGHDHGPAKRVIPFADPKSNTRVIAMTSGKGGVGKSSVTVNVAVALADSGYRVGILDADVYGFSIPKMLGIQEKPEVVGTMMIPPSAHGVKCISIGYFVDDNKPVMWRGPMLHKALEQFLVDVDWGELDFLIIDMPPGTGDVAMSIANYLPKAEVHVVTTPQPAAQRVAQRSGAMAREINLPLSGVIENMSWFIGDDNKRYEIFGAGGGEALAQSLGTTLLGQIPLVTGLRQGGDEGTPIVVSEPQSDAAFAFEQLAKTIEKAIPRRIYREALKVS